MMFVSIPFTALDHPGSAHAGNFYIASSIFTAAVVHSAVFRLFFGEKEFPLRSVNGLLFFLMDLLLLNLVDGGVFALSLLVDTIPDEAVRYLLSFLAILLMMVVFSEFSSNFLAMMVSFLAAWLLTLTGSVSYYLCLPLILLTQALGLSGIFPLEFFVALCTVLLTLGFSVLLERFGLMALWQKLCSKLTTAKIFFLLPWLLLSLGLVYAAVRALVL